jgi:amino acid adenylation domain-containing protein
MEHLRSLIIGPESPLVLSTVSTAFIAQCALTPQATAIQHDLGTLLYSDIIADAAAIVAVLDQAGCMARSFIALVVPRSPAFVTSFLSILIHGSAFVPIDPKLPEQRISFMLDDCTPAMLLLHKSNSGGVPVSHNHIASFPLDQIRSETFKERPTSRCASQGLAYALFTSGTTGRPKGVQVQHDSLANIVNYYVQRWEIRSHDCVFLFSPPSFDPSVLDCAAALCGGASVFVFNGEDILGALENSPATVIDITPSAWAIVRKAPKTLRLVIVGGEPLPLESARRWATSPYMLVNSYGPTETTIVATEAVVAAHVEEITIGDPAWNYLCYVVNEAMQLIEPGETGELCIGGIGVARGYLRRAELTTERFQRNPFAEGRVYKTGDLVRWAANGRELIHLGRMDSQVKLRGQRIELSEIESVALKHHEITDAAATILGDHIYLYITPAIASTASVQPLLELHLSQYMLPSLIIPLDHLPQTSNGKLDRRALVNWCCVVGYTTFVHRKKFSDVVRREEVRRVLMGFLGDAVVLEEFPMLDSDTIDIAFLQCIAKKGEETVTDEESCAGDSGGDVGVLAAFRTVFRGRKLTKASSLKEMGGNSLEVAALVRLLGLTPADIIRLDTIDALQKAIDGPLDTASSLQTFGDSQGAGTSKAPPALDLGSFRPFVMGDTELAKRVYFLCGSVTMPEVEYGHSCWCPSVLIRSHYQERKQRRQNLEEQALHAIAKLMELHPPLRARYTSCGDVDFPWTAKHAKVAVPAGAAFRDCVTSELFGTPLFKWAVQDDRQLTFFIHHFICDAESVPIIRRDLTALLKEETLPPRPYHLLPSVAELLTEYKPAGNIAPLAASDASAIEGLTQWNFRWQGAEIPSSCDVLASVVHALVQANRASTEATALSLVKDARFLSLMRYPISSLVSCLLVEIECQFNATFDVEQVRRIIDGSCRVVGGGSTTLDAEAPTGLLNVNYVIEDEAEISLIAPAYVASETDGQMMRQRCAEPGVPDHMNIRFFPRTKACILQGLLGSARLDESHEWFSKFEEALLHNLYKGAAPYSVVHGPSVAVGNTQLQWDPSAICDGSTAASRAEWLVLNEGLSLNDARRRVMNDYDVILGTGEHGCHIWHRLQA